MRKFALLFLLAAGFVAPKIAIAQDAKIEVAGVSIGKKVNSAAEEMFMFKADGTKLYTLVSLPGKSLIAVDRGACKFEKFADDKGTALFAPLGHAPETDDWLGSFGPKITGDGKYCGLTVEAPGKPAADATKLLFDASLVLRCGSAPKTVEQKNVALKKGTKITVGPVPYEIVAAAPTGNELNIELKARASLERIIKVAFFDAAGKEIKSHTAGYESSSFFNTYEVVETYVLSRKATVTNVKITFYSQTETVTVPVKIETGLGL